MARAERGQIAARGFDHACLAPYDSFVVRIAFLLLFFVAPSCASEEPLGGYKTCDQEILLTNPLEGRLHSQPCATDADCLYGVCHQSPAVSGSISFCTKPCACGPGSACGDEDGAGWTFACQVFNVMNHPDETLSSFCTQVCETLADCPEPYDTCRVITGSNKVCAYRGSRG